MRTYRVAITGGRDHEITQEEAVQLHRILLAREETSRWGGDPDSRLIVIHGNCRGVDQRAAQLAEEWGYPTVPFEAPWDWQIRGWQNGPLWCSESGEKLLGRGAGPLRNWMMLQAADLVIAFSGGRGTADCVRQAEKKGIEVVRVGGGG